MLLAGGPRHHDAEFVQVIAEHVALSDVQEEEDGSDSAQ